MQDGQQVIAVSKPISMDYDINTSHPNKERLEEIHEFIDECSSLPEDDDLRLTYMQKLRQKSIKFSLYKDDKLLEFLKQIVYNSKDKHIDPRSSLCLTF